MPRKRKAYYAEVYDGGHHKSNDNSSLPDKIKCVVCHKVRMKSAFSNRQLEILHDAIARQGERALKGPGYARCRTCAGGQAVEMKCVVCRTTKCLDEFAKSQRSNRDNARCMTCVQRQCAVVLAAQDEKEQDKNNRLKQAPPTETAETDEEDSMVDDMERLTIGSTVDSEDDSDHDSDDDDEQSVGDGVWFEKRPDDDGAKSSKSKGTSVGGFSSTADTKPVRSSRADIVSMDVPKSEPRHRGPPPKRESKFAKVRAYVPEPEERPMLPPEPEPEPEGEPDSDLDEGSLEDFV